jgi:hypothetical protein
MSSAQHYDDQAPGPVSVYDSSPAERRAATLYVCSRLDAADARVVLEALALIPTKEAG